MINDKDNQKSLEIFMLGAIIGLLGNFIVSSLFGIFENSGLKQIIYMGILVLSLFSFTEVCSRATKIFTIKEGKIRRTYYVLIICFGYISSFVSLAIFIYLIVPTYNLSPTFMGFLGGLLYCIILAKSWKELISLKFFIPRVLLCVILGFSYGLLIINWGFPNKVSSLIFSYAVSDMIISLLSKIK